MLTGSEMAVVDANAAGLGVPRKQLMESSGNAVARVVRDVADPGDSITVVAGRGNNGGDAFVAARFLEEFDLRVRLLGRAETITTEIARENWDALRQSEIDAREIHDSTGPDVDGDVVVDAMLGTGISGDLREPERTAARQIARTAATVVSVDVPSGLDAETGTFAELAVSPDHVITFHDTKPGLPGLDADVTVADIGIPDAAETFTGPGDLLRVSRDPASHKGDHGEVLVVGGGPYTGAPALAGQAALRAGADLVRVACPAAIAREVQGYCADLIVRPIEGERVGPENVDRLLALAADHDATVLGPGLGDAPETVSAVESVLDGCDGRVVVDADALQVVPAVETAADLLCTPHRGELGAMGGPQSDDWRERRDLVADFAADLGHTLLVKGPYDVVSDGTRERVNRTGNPGMTVGGTGDVLAGVTGALASTQLPVHAAAIGAYVTGLAGDAVADRRGESGLLAGDLLEAIPAVISAAE
jgi:NAD(P)H-hydrate epimerase